MISRCEHGTPMALCRKCFPDVSEQPDWSKYRHTHPVKELTDEEIWEVIDNCFGVHAFNLDYQIALDEAREDAFELVKVILRKAQEK